jgi:hypothetical protein
MPLDIKPYRPYNIKADESYKEYAGIKWMPPHIVPFDKVSVDIVSIP